MAGVAAAAVVPRDDRLVGFRNPSGNTCFLNAALQVLLSSERVVAALEMHAAQGCGLLGRCVACALRRDYRETVRTSATSTLPAATLRLLPRLMPCMEPGSQQDSQQFLQSLLGELNRDLGRLGFRQGEEQFTTQCLKCGQACVARAQKIWGVSVKLLPSLAEAVEAFFGADELSGSEMPQCYRCGRATPAARTGRLVVAPELLIVQLARFQFSREEGRSVRCDDEPTISADLDVSAFRRPGDDADPELPENKLRLLGIVMHRGRTVDSGHYVSAVPVLPPGSGVIGVPADLLEWHLFNDSTASTGILFEHGWLKDVYYAVYESCAPGPVFRGPFVNPVRREPAPQTRGPIDNIRRGPAPHTGSPVDPVPTLTALPPEVLARRRVRELALACPPAAPPSPPSFLTPPARTAPSVVTPPLWAARSYPCRTGAGGRGDPASAYYRPHPDPGAVLDASDEESETRLPLPADLHDWPPALPLHRCPEPGCRTEWRSAAAAERHWLRGHASRWSRDLPDRRPHACPHRGCRRPFVSADHLHRHLGKHARADDRWASRQHGARPPHECRICKEQFEDCRGLRRHAKAFGDRRAYGQCSKCERRHARRLQRNDWELRLRPWEAAREALLSQPSEDPGGADQSEAVPLPVRWAVVS
ncbi:hypothetical protein ONE63_006474 [Megalurothrips usitatus]|uniref:Ubiquitin carboxyl-terminal hydrolase 36 n=1 Tax=Megalurothrips usitatus TaxID=439358 RepID=A0AAV7XWP8_9NEOP|nr:hypothetical protein ONE63_006474 [Megalurothrips usitatus]